MIYYVCKVERVPLKKIPSRQKAGYMIMALSKQRKEYLYEYQKNKLKRIPLDVTRAKYEEIAAAAEQVGKSVNGFIKEAIDEKMEHLPIVINE